jgi:hypothetical protein
MGTQEKRIVLMEMIVSLCPLCVSSFAVFACKPFRVKTLMHAKGMEDK